MKKKSVIFLFLCASVACANQINMNRVKPVTTSVQSENNNAVQGEQDVDDFTDFGTEGEIDIAELAQPKMIVWLNVVFSRLCALYNWFNSKN